MNGLECHLVDVWGTGSTRFVLLPHLGCTFSGSGFWARRLGPSLPAKKLCIDDHQVSQIDGPRNFESPANPQQQMLRILFPHGNHHCAEFGNCYVDCKNAKEGFHVWTPSQLKHPFLLPLTMPFQFQKTLSLPTSPKP